MITEAMVYRAVCDAGCSVTHYAPSEDALEGYWGEISQFDWSEKFYACRPAHVAKAARAAADRLVERNKPAKSESDTADDAEPEIEDPEE